MDPSKVRQERYPKFYSERDLCQISCRACNERLSSMRKTAVRWLYMEWYKKAMLGQSLPSVQELTPTIIAVLQVVHEDKSRENNNTYQCSVCDRNLDTLIKQALTPLHQHQNMQSASLPRNFSLAATAGRKQSKEDAYLSPAVKSYINSIDAEFNSNLEMNMDEKGGIISEEPNDLSSDSSAASFFLRAAQRLSLSSKRRHRKSRRSAKHKDSDAASTSAQEQGAFPTNFADLIMRCPPQAPPSLFKNAARKSGDANGKVKVMLRVSDLDDTNTPSCLRLDPKKKQAYLCDIRDASKSPRLGKEAKLYQFDTMFDSTTTKPEICSSSLIDLLHTVVDYSEDASFIVYGHPNLGKTSTMLGEDDRCENLGIIPSAISWLYQLIEDRKERTGARFSVRVSAIEVVGKSENLKDLLADQASGSVNNCSTSPSLYLQQERTGPVQFADFTELRAPSAEKASFYFDAAVASRTKPSHDDTSIDSNEDPCERQNSNMIFTFHVYQYLIDKVGTGDIHGGRSRFHFIDLSGCKRAKRNKESQGSWLSLSNLGSILVALANGAKHIPHRDSKLTVLLREAFGALSSRIALTAFVSGDPKKYTETLSTMEVTTRIHRSRRKKSRYSSGSSGGDSSCDEARRVRRRPKPVQPMLVTRACESDTIGDSEFTTSAAEDSCDTVIYVGPKGQAVSDTELTDFERPPSPNGIYPSKDDLLEKELSISDDDDDDDIEFKPEIIEKHCSCNLKNNSTSSTCIHTTEMKTVDTTYKSEQSLLASFSDHVDKSSTKTLTRSLSKEELSEYDLSQPAREALEHPSTPYYFLVPGCPKSDSNGLINNFIQRRNRPIFHSYRERTSSQQFSSQEQINSTRGRKSSRDESPPNRTASLDRYFLRTEKSQNETEPCPLHGSNSNDSIASSQRTVCEFERDLVSKIVERFDVEQEIADMEPDLISSYLEKEEMNNIQEDNDYYNKRISSDDSIIVTVTSQERLDPSYIDSLNLTDTLRKQREASFSEFLKNTDSQNASERPDHEDVQPWEPRSNFPKDSAENFTSKDQDGRGTASRLDSASSCGSLLAIPKAVGLPSEGVSSGYESMRCESSGNLNTVSDLDSERGKSKSNKKDKKSSLSKGKDKKNCKDTPSIPESGIFNLEGNSDKTRFGKSKSHKKDVKVLMSERKSMKESLQQVLQKLVLLKEPVTDVDARLKGLSYDDPQVVRTLNRENRILQRKVDVCKSHLQLVTCFDANPQKVVTRTFLYKTTAV